MIYDYLYITIKQSVIKIKLKTCHICYSIYIFAVINYILLTFYKNSILNIIILNRLVITFLKNSECVGNIFYSYSVFINHY